MLYSIGSVTINSKLGNATTLNVAVNASTNYYWYVVVKDGKGGETKGQVWNFKTD
ncbi:hypothetical protein [uncultured Lutibacter sp.]|uniref:hypothetical protein n=1 Tax=uncultured Lutibacter sp. TaxID=437739 RepID=UPI002612E25F|nr:hypothetical protein [uncultured Lutibacter sp.]